jgi:hypothetical protein
MNGYLISKIAERAVSLFACDKIEILIDIYYCIEGGCDLDLDGLLHADEFDFRHDIVGIHNNLNHETKKLEHCFLPRFSK